MNPETDDTAPPAPAPLTLAEELCRIRGDRDYAGALPRDLVEADPARGPRTSA